VCKLRRAVALGQRFAVLVAVLAGGDGTSAFRLLRDLQLLPMWPRDALPPRKCDYDYAMDERANQCPSCFRHCRFVGELTIPLKASGRQGPLVALCLYLSKSSAACCSHGLCDAVAVLVRTYAGEGFRASEGRPISQWIDALIVSAARGRGKKRGRESRGRGVPALRPTPWTLAAKFMVSLTVSSGRCKSVCSTYADVR